MSLVEVLQMGPYPDWDQKPLDEAFKMHRYFEANDPSELVDNHAGDIKAIATRGEIGATAELINKLPNLEIISVYGVGFDAVDINACKERNIRVTNTPDVLTKDVADLGIAMMLNQSRGMIGAEKWVRSGDWEKEGLYPLKHLSLIHI